MGTWGTGIFDSDDALDFVADLGRRPTKRAVLDALAQVRDAEHAELGLAGVGVRALCAAELMARSSGKTAIDVPEGVEAMQLAWKATGAEIALAARAIENVATYSELAALWDEAGKYAAWTEALDDLRARLGAAPLPRTRPTFASTIPSAPTNTDVERAIDAMRAGVLRAALVRHEIEATERGLQEFARAALPANAPWEDGGDEPLAARDVERLRHGNPLYLTEESSVLERHESKAADFYLDDLAPPLWRLMRCALIAGRKVPHGTEQSVLLDRVRFAHLVLELLRVLGGDAEVGLLSLVSGKEADEDGSFGRALAFAHACGLWAVATVEEAADTRAKPGLAAAAPLLVLARFRLRLRAKWDPTPARDEAARRMPAWRTQPAARLEEVSRRADALADFVAACEASPPAATDARSVSKGSLVVQKRRGVTVALGIVGAHILVGAYGRPSRPYTRVAASFVTPVQVPAEVGRVFVRAPSDLPQ